MTLAGIKVGDVVHVDKKGRRFYALAGERFYGPAGSGKVAGIDITPLCRETYRTATSREIVGHYRKAAGSA